MAHRPVWCEIRPDPPPDPTLGFLDTGEHAAIVLALSVHADGLLIDERAGRTEAERRHLQVTGTIRVWPKRTVPACSISKRTSAACVKQTSISRKPFSGSCASNCRKKRGWYEDHAKIRTPSVRYLFLSEILISAIKP